MIRGVVTEHAAVLKRDRDQEVSKIDSVRGFVWVVALKIDRWKKNR